MSSTAPLPRAELVRDAADFRMILSGRWALDAPTPSSRDLDTFLAGAPRPRVRAELRSENWDSALPAFLTAVDKRLRQRGGALDVSALPPTLQTLLVLASDAPAVVGGDAHASRLLERIGLAAEARWRATLDFIALLGDAIGRVARLPRGRILARKEDVFALLKGVSVDALPITAVVNLLVGAILAFVGAVQLERFGAEVLVANLVGIAVSREMAAVMTAIVLAGRTGAAYAAELATMQGAEEIDALRVAGIPIGDYLVLPRMLALTIMSPLIYLYACLFGLLGGLVTCAAILDLSPAAYIQQTLKVVDARHFMIGGAKSLVFGATLGLVACHFGLRAGRSASDVGLAATRAVVVCIVAVIGLDAVFALLAQALNL